MQGFVCTMRTISLESCWSKDWKNYM